MAGKQAESELKSRYNPRLHAPQGGMAGAKRTLVNYGSSE